MPMITVYRNGRFAREETPTRISDARKAVLEASKNYPGAFAEYLEARLIRVNGTWEFEEFGFADVYELSDEAGCLVEITTGDDLVETVYIPQREELLPFVVKYALPICRGQGQIEVIASLARIANVLGTIAEEQFDIEIDEFSGHPQQDHAGERRRRDHRRERQ